MNKGQHNTFKKLSPDFFSIEVKNEIVYIQYDITYNHYIGKGIYYL